MSDKKSNDDKSNYAIGGGVLLGLGSGFFFFPVSVFGYTSVFAFVGCIIGGVGLGLLVAAILGRNQKGN